MSHNASTSNRTMRNKFGSISTNGSSEVLADQQLQTYTDHYGGKWVRKKIDFFNIPIYTYESLGSVEHIMVGKPTKLSTNTTATEFAVAEPPWSSLYEKRCELEVYCQWHGLQVPKARSAELPKDEPANILDHFHAIQKARKHLKGKAQE